MSKDELKEFMKLASVEDIDDSRLDEIFAEMDADGNGSVDLKEFVEYTQIKLPSKKEGTRKDIYSDLFAPAEKVAQDKAK